MNLLSILAGILTGKAGESIGSAVSTGAQLAALVAAVSPVAVWLSGHKDDVFLTLSYGDLAFWAAILGLQAAIVVRLVHRAAPPA